MIIDLLSDSNILSYNIKAAHILGLDSSIYLSALVRLYTAQYNNLDEEGFFNLDRQYISALTTYGIDDQRVIEGKLQQVNLIQVKDLKIKFDVELYASILLEDDKKLIDGVKKTLKIATPKKNMTVREKQAHELKSKIVCNDPQILAALLDWVDGVYANPKGFLSTKSITIFQKTVDEFAKGNLNIALKIIDIATVNGYRDATWAINSFEKDNPKEYKQHIAMSNSQISVVKPKLSDQVF